VAVLVRRCGLSLRDAWAATHADMAMLIAYEDGFRDANKPAHLWDADKVADLEEHIQAMQKAKEREKKQGATP
jgi:hypothetical protein